MILAICSNLDGKHGVLSPSNKLSDFADDTRLTQYNFADDTHAQYNFADDTRRAKYQDSGSCIHIEIKTWESYVFSPHCETSLSC